jgi:hypothetical protein
VKKDNREKEKEKEKKKKKGEREKKEKKRKKIYIPSKTFCNRQFFQSAHLYLLKMIIYSKQQTSPTELS